MTSKTYVGDIGTVITLDCGTDISTATARSIEVRKPNGESVTWPASASGTTAITYTILDGDLDVAGSWTLQAHVTLSTGEWLGESVRRVVYAAFA